MTLRRKRKILIWNTFGRITQYLRKYSQKNANFWEQKLLLLIKRYIQVPWTYPKVSFVYSKQPLWNIIFQQKSAQLGGSKHASNLLRIIRSRNCKLSMWILVEILRKSQSLV